MITHHCFAILFLPTQLLLSDDGSLSDAGFSDDGYYMEFDVDE